VDPIGCFLSEVVSIESVESDEVTKDDFYEVYKRYCGKHTLAVESKINFGRKIKDRFQEARETTGERRRTVWKGIRLTEEYRIDLVQRQLSDLISK
jgi:hypothetical protein